MTKKTLAVMVPAITAALLVTLVGAKPLIRMAYGSAFDPSYSAVAWLLPGIGCLAVNMILMNFLASCRMPLTAVYPPLVAFVVNVGLNLAIVPVMGFAGAALTSSIAYGQSC